MLLTATQLYDLALDLQKSKAIGQKWDEAPHSITGKPALPNYDKPIKSEIKVNDPYDVPDHVDHHIRSVLGDKWKKHLKRFSKEVDSGSHDKEIDSGKDYDYAGKPSPVRRAMDAWIRGDCKSHPSRPQRKLSMAHWRGAGQAVLTHDKDAMRHASKISDSTPKGSRDHGDSEHAGGVAAALLSRLPLNHKVIRKQHGPITHLYRHSDQHLKGAKVGDHIHLPYPTSFSSDDTYCQGSKSVMKLKLPSRGFSLGRYADEVLVSGHHKITHIEKTPTGKIYHVEEHNPEQSEKVHKSFEVMSDELEEFFKAKKQPTQTGPRGGRFYVTQAGAKTYSPEQKVEPALVINTASAPHLSKPVEAEVKIVSGKKELPAWIRQKMKVSPPKSMADKQSKRAYIQAKMSSNWPAYFCRGCNAAIVPTHDQPVTVQRAIKNPRTGKVEGRVEETLGHTTEVMKKDPKTGKTTYIDPPDPAAVAQKLCPDCFGKHEVQSRTVEGHFPAPKPTKASRAKVRESKAADRSLKAALKKPEDKRTPEQQMKVTEYEAVLSVKDRIEEDRTKAAGPPTVERREREAAQAEKQESESQDKIRAYAKKHLISTGVSEKEAEQAVQKFGPEELRLIQQSGERAVSARMEETRKRMGKELSGQRVARVINLGDLLDLMERRKEGGKEEHAATVEGLHPAVAHAVEFKRTQRMRERQEELEKKTQKSLWVYL